MFCGRQTERLRLRVFLWMQASLNLPVADDDSGQHHAEECCADSNHTREADSLEHDIAEPGDLVSLDDFHYDRRAWCLHWLIVLQA